MTESVGLIIPYLLWISFIGACAGMVWRWFVGSADEAYDRED